LCFVERGYDQTTMKDIAAAADMTAGALYHHFSSKQELFAAAFRRHLETAFDALEKAVSKGGSFTELVTLVLDAAAELYNIDRVLAAFTGVANIELQRHPELREVVGDDARAVYRFFERMLAATPDEMSADDLEGLVSMFVAMFSGFSMFGVGPRGAAAQQAGIKAFRQVLTGTLLV
jgi:AcrR family transcriptional regulator